MASDDLSEIIRGIEESSFNPRHALIWLEQQPENEQTLKVQELFRALLLSASKPKQSSGNACVKLCGLVELCARSTSLRLREFAFTEDTAATIFNFFIEWNEQDAHRSMRLVLDFLTYSAAQNPSLEVGLSIKSKILDETVSIITEKSSRPSIKSALTALDHILQKKLIYLDDVLATYKKIHQSKMSQGTTWQNFVSQIFDWMVLHYVCPAAGKLIVTILTASLSKDGDERHPPSTWHDFIYPPLEANADLLESVRLYILMPLFKTDRAGALEYLQRLTSLQGLTGDRGEGWNLNAMLWLSMLEAGKKAGVVDEPGQGLKQKPGAVTQLDAHVLEEVLCHDSHDARSSAVAILIASPSTTRPYTPEVLNLLKKHLPSFHSDSNSKFRYEVLGHSRNMIKRIHGALESVRRDYEKAVKKAKNTSSQGTASNAGASHVEMTLRQHREFVFWYFDFLKNEMSPTASYQRHITSLKATNYVLSSPLVQESEISMFGEVSSPFVDSVWLRCVLDLVMDPFDDVRDAAAGLIMSLASTSTKSPTPSRIGDRDAQMATELEEFCKRADLLASRTARADHSDGAARSYHLLHLWRSQCGESLKVPQLILDDLEKKIISAEKDLAAAVLESPVHGNFASLRYLWSSLSTSSLSVEDREVLYAIQNRTIQCCSKIWDIVQHILCDDSPEGHLPEDLEEVDGLDTKDLLSYSFRAVHESSNLLRVIASRLASESKIKPSADARASFEIIGRLTFQELSNLRHRGAFTTVSQTFATCCQLVQYFPVESNGANLLNEWYLGALECIHTQASTTRRSAGIPALIVGVLSSNAEEPSFHDVVRELQRISRRPARVAETDGSNLSQVHALNCLKDIFKSSYLSKKAEPYLTECLELAAECLKSEVWAIRNCGLILLRSLIDCLLGTNESKASIEAGWAGKTTRIPYHKFAQLPAVLVNLLQMGQQAEGVLIGSQSAESVFPALDIIRRAGPPEAARDELYELISWYLGSRIWHVREIAARTLCSFLLQPGWSEDVQDLVLKSTSSANKLHGALMTLRFLLERLSEVMPEQISAMTLTSLSTMLSSVVDIVSDGSSCSEVQAVYIDVVNTIIKLASQESARTGLSHIAIPKAILDDGFKDRTSALLHLRLGEAQTQAVTQIAPGSANNTLKAALKDALETDINVSCAMLERLSRLPTDMDKDTFVVLLDANMSVCFETRATEPVSLALENLGALLNQAISAPSPEFSLLPATEELVRLWENITRLPITPSLSESIMQVGGCILAVVIARDEPVYQRMLPTWLRTWGFMMTTAGSADQTFDTRFAAASAMLSISTAMRLSPALPDSTVTNNDNDNTSNPSPPPPLDEAHLPWLLALYDSLDDDDDEVRAVAAAATGNILLPGHGGAQALASIEAAARLLAWLCEQFGSGSSSAIEFRAEVACRLAVGQNTGGYEDTETSWPPADEQLRLAMRFDDALFVVEEQNLYVDEVREAQRWRAALIACFPRLLSSSSSLESHPVLEALSTWTLEALQTLNRIAAGDDEGGEGKEAEEQKEKQRQQGRDGPLGWTSKPAVYAICYRILTCGVSLVGSAVPEPETGGSAGAGAGAGDGVKVAEKEARNDKKRELIRRELVRFAEIGRKNEVHGLLVALCEGF
ncbi:putative death-receptor fusion protein-domain-containing protein [Microdochium trichocladiopsis]|uniref:Death-receptor fusion protein-domain-containing protein n=1 Tax=Microdochium trichocladiopsis TaxID=1682393 RepID=A0A9P8YIY9_9PEZI|nr:putative death-receptor fusion protein-domain-containing protein [Microdochium trichocladiopsis]KAH7041120.1 putative death-receptor fusion protein-domain-containing protein [Microdochium trichocladiopsis]